MKFIIFSLLTSLVLTGCSAKEINEGVDGIVNDVSKTFNDSKDNSN